MIATEFWHPNKNPFFPSGSVGQGRDGDMEARLGSFGERVNSLCADTSARISEVVDRLGKLEHRALSVASTLAEAFLLGQDIKLTHLSPQDTHLVADILSPLIGVVSNPASGVRQFISPRPYSSAKERNRQLRRATGVVAARLEEFFSQTTGERVDRKRQNTIKETAAVLLKELRQREVKNGDVSLFFHNLDEVARKPVEITRFITQRLISGDTAFQHITSLFVQAAKRVILENISPESTHGVVFLLERHRATRATSQLPKIIQTLVLLGVLTVACAPPVMESTPTVPRPACQSVYQKLPEPVMLRTFPTGLASGTGIGSFMEEVNGEMSKEKDLYLEAFSLIKAAKIYKRLWSKSDMFDPAIKRYDPDGHLSINLVFDKVIAIVEKNIGPIEDCGGQLLEDVNSPLMRQTAKDIEDKIFKLAYTNTDIQVTPAITPIYRNENTAGGVTQQDIDIAGRDKLQLALRYMLESGDPELRRYAQALADLRSAKVPSTLDLHGCSYTPLPLRLRVSTHEENPNGAYYTAVSYYTLNPDDRLGLSLVEIRLSQLLALAGTKESIALALVKEMAVIEALAKLFSQTLQPGQCGQ